MDSISLTIVRAIVLGFAVLLGSAVVAFFVSTDGAPENTSAWPPEARAILKENPGHPRTKEQWRRIEKELLKDPDGPMHSHLLAAEVRKAWFVFFAVALVAVALVRHGLRPLSPLLSSALVAGPTLVALLLAFVHTHPYFF